jgi:hypothetical protein
MATNPEETDADQQRRELEEIRRKFAEVGKRLGSAFEPVPPEVRQPDALLKSVPPTPERPTRPRWQWAAAVALIFVLGTGFGFTLPRSAADDSPPPATATTPAPATTQAPQVRTVPTVPESCLETARKGDQLIAMLMRAKRDPTLLSKAYREYTVASQACREEASR